MKDFSLSEPDLREQIRSGIVYIDLRLDFGFKFVFGRPGQEEALRMLLDSILPEKHIKTVKYGSQENMGDSPLAHRAINDIRCTSKDGTEFVVEMQLSDQDDFGDRMIFYSGFPIRDQIMKGGSTYAFKPVYVAG